MAHLPHLFHYPHDWSHRRNLLMPFHPEAELRDPRPPLHLLYCRARLGLLVHYVTLDSVGGGPRLQETDPPAKQNPQGAGVPA